ncbi:MAG: S9 family peptidase, partial [Planctomycetota bacterium]
MKIAAALSALIASVSLGLAADGPFEYPDAPRVNVVDTYHGIEVADPYRWLENRADDPEVDRWITAQNEITEPYLASLPGRNAIAKELTARLNYERFGTPSERNGRYFFSRNDGLQDQSVFYVSEGLDGEPRVLLDPNTWSSDNTISLAGTSVSRGGKLIAYSLSDGGSDWRDIKVRDIDTGEDLDDLVQWV